MKKLVIMAFLAFLGLSPVIGGNFYRNIKVKQADKLIREHQPKGDLYLLDVRTDGEFGKGHIQGAVNIDFWGKDFEELIGKLDKQRTYLVYCASGVRSGNAMKKMRAQGFTRIYNMKGGMFGWRAAKLPVVVTNQP